MVVWTTPEEIRKQLQVNVIAVPGVTDEELLLEAFDEKQLEHSNIDHDTDVVKGMLQLTPTADAANPITLTGTAVVSLSATHIQRGTMVVAADAGLLVVYTENLDYIVDYCDGTLRRTTGSAIGSATAVYVWYQPFTIYARDQDYTIALDIGQIERRSGGDIESGALVYVDYSFSAITVAENLIRAAIEEAEGLMLLHLKPGFDQYSTDQGLVNASTYLTLTIIALSESQKALKTVTTTDADNVAKQWQELAAKYYEQFQINFSKFTRFRDFNAGGLIKNRFATTRSHNLQSQTVAPRYRRR